MGLRFTKASSTTSSSSRRPLAASPTRLVSVSKADGLPIWLSASAFWPFTSCSCLAKPWPRRKQPGQGLGHGCTGSGSSGSWVCRPVTRLAWLCCRGTGPAEWRRGSSGWPGPCAAESWHGARAAGVQAARRPSRGVVGDAGPPSRAPWVMCSRELACCRCAGSSSTAFERCGGGRRLAWCLASCAAKSWHGPELPVCRQLLDGL